MGSIIDDIFAREGRVDPAYRGISQAHAGDMSWTRDRDESERRFIARIRREALAAGYRVVRVGGHIQCDELPPRSADVVRLVVEDGVELDGPAPGWVA